MRASGRSLDGLAAMRKPAAPVRITCASLDRRIAELRWRDVPVIAQPPYLQLRTAVRR